MFVRLKDTMRKKQKKPESETVYQVTKTIFVAGAVAREGKIVDCAPVIKWMKGMDEKLFLIECRRAGYSCQVAQKNTIVRGRVKKQT